MKRNKFREELIFLESASTLKIDKENNILRDIAMLAVDSANARKYPESVQIAALPLFEGAKAYKNHEMEETHRKVEDLIGQFSNCRVKEGKTYGDLVVIDFPKIFTIAEKTPNLIGFSVDVSGYSESRDGIEIVTEIIKVHSVDLVTEPATTKGLFESKNNQKEEDVKISELTVAELKEQAPKLYTLVFNEGKNSRNDEVKTLTEERDSLKQEKETRQKEEQVKQQKESIDKLLKESELPEKAITDSFKESLYNLAPKKGQDGIDITIEAQATELIEDRVLILKGGVHGNEADFHEETGDEKDKDKDKKADVKLSEALDPAGKYSSGFVVGGSNE